jgi:hypothetical protein
MPPAYIFGLLVLRASTQTTRFLRQHQQKGSWMTVNDQRAYSPVTHESPAPLATARARHREVPHALRTYGRRSCSRCGGQGVPRPDA